MYVARQVGIPQVSLTLDAARTLYSSGTHQGCRGLGHSRYVFNPCDVV